MHFDLQRTPNYIALVSAEDPSAPRQGGQLEVRNRIEALSRISWIKVIAYSDAVLTPTHSVLNVGGERVDLLRIPRRSIPATLLRPRLPVQWARRIPSARSVVACERFLGGGARAAILCDGLFAWPLATILRKDLGVPIFLREHNVESDYIRELGRAAHPPRNWVYFIDALRTARAERAVCQQVGDGGVLTVTSEDAKRLFALTGVQGRVLPSFAGSTTVTPHNLSVQGSVLFAGNLYMPNNVAGLAWFLSSVWPTVVAARPNATLTVAGSRPSAAMLKVVGTARNVELVRDPIDLTNLYRSAACAINPSIFGAGMHMKNLDALRHEVPVVSTPLGAVGFPDGALFVARDAGAFSRRLIQLLDPTTRARLSPDAEARRTVLDDERKAKVLLHWIGAAVDAHRPAG